MQFDAQRAPAPKTGTAAKAATLALRFRHDWLPQWLARVGDPVGGGVFDALDAQGRPDPLADKTVLTQARMLFTLAHLAMLTEDNATLVQAAARQYGVLARYRKGNGLYCRALTHAGQPTGRVADGLARSYDQSFVLLALATWARLSPSAVLDREIADCLAAIDRHLTDPATGLLIEDDGVSDPAAPDAPLRSQNPHMHLYEAYLQAHEMACGETGIDWLARAADLRALALRHFFDAQSGSIREWVAPDLSQAPGDAGLRREPGHQYEWAWLLNREADFSGDGRLRGIAAKLCAFADRHGIATDGPLAGAALDAITPAGAVLENNLLLWPQTEAIKAFAIRHSAGEAAMGARAQALFILMCERWFEGGLWRNQLAPDASVLWPETLTRLVYHLVLALTEGVRAGLWPGEKHG
ncbi:AGE family epimerase/isomerase [Paracoccus cavernae]|uniref:AGE family epimerase/isomerase n=1 Tax=Paracoccus cavernae TaxID=1571207 RepID=UPI0035F4A34D